MKKAYVSPIGTVLRLEALDIITTSGEGIDLSGLEFGNVGAMGENDLPIIFG